MNKKRSQNLASGSSITGRRPLLICLAVVVALVLPDLFMHKHTYFHAYEAWPGFFVLLGLAAVVVLAGIARLVSRLLRRDEDYYG